MTPIFYRESGSGPAIVLIHGFPFDHRIWDGFAQRLSSSFHVFVPDLPGFGKSPLEPMTFSLDDIAVMLCDWLRQTGIAPAAIVGHSLGGYVALGMMAHGEDLITSVTLFHSTAEADSEEKKQSRDKAIAFIDEHGVGAFSSSFIAPLFANSAHPGVAHVRSIARDAPAATVKGYLQAMRERPDRTNLIASFQKPMLFLAGELDKGIPVESIQRQASLGKSTEVCVLSNVAHMGMMEAEKEAGDALLIFLRKKSVT